MQKRRGRPPKPRQQYEHQPGTRKLPEINTLRGVKILEENKIVTSAIARIDSDVLPGQKKKSNAGRKKRFTPTKLKNAVNSYFDWCEENDRVPSIKGLTIHMKIYKDQFYDWMKLPEFRDILEHARLIISEWCENDVYRTPGAASGKIAYMKNIHDWTEKQETTSTVTQITSVEEARAKLEMLAPKLLEALKGSGVISQLLPAQKETVIEAVEETLPKETEEQELRRLNATVLELKRKSK